MKTKWKKIPLMIAGLIALSQPANSYDIIKRAKITDDKFKTLEMMRPIRHDFFININGAYSTQTLDLIDDAKSIDNIDKTLSTSQQISKTNETLNKYYNNEQVLRANVGLGFPIFSFDLFGINWKPNFRARAGLFAMLTPQKDNLSIIDIINNLEQIPAEYRTKLQSCIGTPPADGTDLLVHCVPSSLSQVEADVIKSTYGITELPYSSFLATSQEVPAIEIYAKGEAKVGFFVDYKKDKHWFGDFGFYALGRADIKKRADALLLLGGGGNTDFADNTTVNAAADYTLGYKNSNYSVSLGVEELKLTTIKDPKEGTVSYGDDPLLRIHAQADYRLWVFKLSPYLGSHARSGYGFGDAYYLGADWGMYVWGDRLGLNLKTQIDKEHMTLGLRAKLWFFHADFTSKVPIKSEVDGIKVNSIHSGNIRFFF